LIMNAVAAGPRHGPRCLAEIHVPAGPDASVAVPAIPDVPPQNLRRPGPENYPDS